jgi:hypothetical protein
VWQRVASNPSATMPLPTGPVLCCEPATAAGFEQCTLRCSDEPF